MYEIDNAEVIPSLPGITFPLGEHSRVFISRLSAGESDKEFTGNILRRTCTVVGEAACAATCQLRDIDLEQFNTNDEKACADANLRDVLLALEAAPKHVLMVAVTGDKVGFADRLDEYEEAGGVRVNPEGWREIPGYNAFFARTSETEAIGSRLADCAHLGFEFTDRNGEQVFGFEHGTRPNMKGKTDFAFEIDGKKVSYTEFVLNQAIQHYGADPKAVKIRLSSSIQAQNFVKHFSSEEQREAHVPGWFTDGFVKNMTRPDWEEGDAYDQNDIWYADSRGLIIRDIYEAMERFGIPLDNFDATEMIDPAETDGEFSSYEKRADYGDYRDLYLVGKLSGLGKI